MTSPVTSDAPTPVVVDHRADGRGRVRGRVWWFCADRGFGWLLDDRDRAWFIAWNDLPGHGFRCLEDGMAVSFRADRDRHGPVAREVVVEPAHQRDPRRLAG